MDTNLDLNEDWQQYQDALEWHDYQGLLALGISGWSLIDRDRHELRVGVVDIAVEKGRWIPRFNGERAFCIAARDENDNVVEIIAFKPRAPKAWWCRSGHVAVLGHEALESAQYDRAPLFAAETPIEWLRTGCQGVVFLDLKHYWPLYLSGIPAIHTSSREFGTRLYDALQRPFDIPDVRFPA